MHPRREVYEACEYMVKAFKLKLSQNYGKASCSMYAAEAPVMTNCCDAHTQDKDHPWTWSGLSVDLCE